MKLQISPSAACSLAQLAIVGRVVCGIVIDMPELLNASWLAIASGGLLAAIPTFAVARLKKSRFCSAPRILYAVLLTLSILDAAAVSSAIADSAGYMALNSTAAVYLMIPQLILCLLCLRLNGDALGSSAGIWGRLLPFLLLLVFFLQAEDYRPGWLTPVLGPGFRTILHGAIRSAGWFTLPTLLYLSCDPDAESASPLRPTRALCISAAFAVLTALAFNMMLPAIADRNLFDRSFRLDALLANGRAGLSLQLPSIALWYVGLFYALLFDLFTASVMAQSFLPGWSRDSCIWLSVILTALLSAGSLTAKFASETCADWFYLIQILLLGAVMLTALKRKE